jgi:hypothetical protein
MADTYSGAKRPKAAGGRRATLTDHRTAGGLNEQFLNQMRALGFERGMAAGLEALLDRIMGPRPS